MASGLPSKPRPSPPARRLFLRRQTLPAQFKLKSAQSWLPGKINTIRGCRSRHRKRSITAAVRRAFSHPPRLAATASKGGSMGYAYANDGLSWRAWNDANTIAPGEVFFATQPVAADLAAAFPNHTASANAAAGRAGFQAAVQAGCHVVSTGT